MGLSVDGITRVLGVNRGNVQVIRSRAEQQFTAAQNTLDLGSRGVFSENR